MSQDKKTTGDSPSTKSHHTTGKAEYLPVKQPIVSTDTVESPEPLPDASPADTAERTPTAVDKGKGKDLVELTGDASATTTITESASSNGGSSAPPSRKPSVSSVSFLAPAHPSLPQGLMKPHRAGRIRDSSPPHRRPDKCSPQPQGGPTWTRCQQLGEVGSLSVPPVTMTLQHDWPPVASSQLVLHMQCARTKRNADEDLVKSLNQSHMGFSLSDSPNSTFTPFYIMSPGVIGLLAARALSHAPWIHLQEGRGLKAQQSGQAGSWLEHILGYRRQCLGSPPSQGFLLPQPRFNFSPHPFPGPHSISHFQPLTPHTFGQYSLLLSPALNEPHAKLMATETLTESPRPKRFESHVAFDNIPLGDSTNYNPLSFTLNVRHAGFQYRRRHRTFMVGVDDNSYSDHALQWLLDELVDDGDEIVCIRVLENQPRSNDKAYQDEAKALMDSIQAKNTQNRAIGLVLEYAVGKLHSTFQHLIKMYQPSMLVVGTKGRSMDGVQGFLVNRSSFSKYCLQYSPVPVVVVRPTEKREKKKAKRAGDPSRQSYIHMLAGQKHEADSETNSAYEWEPKITADEEAHRVAMAVGLPAAYDPTIKPIDPVKLLASSSRRSASGTRSRDSSPAGQIKAAPPPSRKPGEGDDSDSEFEEEFEVTEGEQLLKKEILHQMEHNEGAALRSETRKMSAGSTDSDEDAPGSGGAKT